MSEINVSGCCHNNSTNENGMCEIYKCRCYQRYCYYKQRQQLKAENEELQDSLGLANRYVNKYKATLDKIESMCKLSLHCDNCYLILQLIEQVKKGEEW